MNLISFNKLKSYLLSPYEGHIIGTKEFMEILAKIVNVMENSYMSEEKKKSLMIDVLNSIIRDNLQNNNESNTLRMLHNEFVEYYLECYI